MDNISDLLWASFVFSSGPLLRWLFLINLSKEVSGAQNSLIVQKRKNPQNLSLSPSLSLLQCNLPYLWRKNLLSDFDLVFSVITPQGRDKDQLINQMLWLMALLLLHHHGPVSMITETQYGPFSCHDREQGSKTLPLGMDIPSSTEEGMPSFSKS